MLSPCYLNYVTHLIGIVIAKGIMVGFGPLDNNHLVLIALLLGHDEQARMEIENRLLDHGDLVREIWNQLYVAVNEHNTQGVTSVSLDLNQTMQRILDENRG